MEHASACERDGALTVFLIDHAADWGRRLYRLLLWLLRRHHIRLIRLTAQTNAVAGFALENRVGVRVV